MRDQQHRSARDLRHRGLGRRRFGGELFGHPVPDPFGDGEFVALGPELRA
ncbi:hypothetical protein AB0L75_25020 [Streptomyces sp. NPDC052101]